MDTKRWLPSAPEIVHCLSVGPVGICSMDDGDDRHGVASFIDSAVIAHAGAPRCRIAAASDCSVSPSPPASSASEAANWRMVSVSERIAIVSSSASRSSMVTSVTNLKKP